MSATRLTALDASFLEVETPTAHMHVGWAALLDPPTDRPRPGFEELREHIRGRLGRAPRFRQMLRHVPLGLSAPFWVDDPGFELERHVIAADAERLAEVVDACMSEPLPRDRPLWQIWIAPRVEEGRIALVGKLHHCMVDGIAAVQLGSLLLDPTPEPPQPEPDRWRPSPAPGRAELLVRGAVALARDQLTLASIPARIAGSPQRLGDAVTRSGRALQALADSVRPARAVAALNPPISERRRLAHTDRPLDELLEMKRDLGVKLNDVVLAVATSAVRRLLAERHEGPLAVKAMVPVNVRSETEGDELGNRLSFMFVDLPCDEPDPIRRLRQVHAETDDRKRRGVPEGSDEVLGVLGFVPPPVRRLFSHLVASPRTFNLVVSNIPGPRGEAYVAGCALRCAYPVVPLADRHALSIGFTTVAERACFGLYASPDALPEVDELPGFIDEALDELRRAGRPEADAALALG